MAGRTWLEGAGLRTLKEKVWWERIAQGRCPICAAKGPFKSGAIPVSICECGNCKCESCVDRRDREMKGLPPRSTETAGGIIVPSLEEERKYNSKD